MSTEDDDRLTDKDIAEFIVDALLVAGIVKPDQVQRAVLIVAEEITVRRALNDL
jgi:hypothetical protein